jgi:hypothetical protein
MNSKEIIERTIKFKKPDRLGLYYLLGNKLHSDIYLDHSDEPVFENKKRIEDNFELWEDVWGNTWGRLISDKTTHGEVIRGVLADWRCLDHYKLPNLADKELFSAMAKRFSYKNEMYKVVEMPGLFFAIARNLRGLDNFLMDIKIERDRVEGLMKHIEALLSEMIVQNAQAGADGIMFYEDWGTQHQLFIHPDDWKDVFKPFMANLFRLAHKNNLSVWMHSCGYIYPIISHLIEIGVDVLQLDQPELMGIERLGKEFGGRVTFWSPCDIQKVLPTGDKQRIETSIRKMFDNLCVNGGGLIAKSYGIREEDLVSIGVKPEWNEFAYQCFMKYDSNNHMG